MNTLNAFLFIGFFSFIWHISGKILCNLLKIRLVNHFLYLPIGFLVFFSWLTITIYPIIVIFNSKITIPIIFYYSLIMIILYISISLFLIKYWLELTIPSWNILIYLILIIVMFCWIYFSTQKNIVNSYFLNLNNKIIWYFNISPIFIKNTIKIFDLFIVIPIIFPKYNEGIINDFNFIYSSIILIKTILLFSIYIFIIGMFAQFKSQFQEIIIRIIVFFVSTALLIYVLKIVNMNNNFELIEFVIYTNAFIVCMFIYYIYSNRQHWISAIIGITTISFFAFDSKYFLGILILYFSLTLLIQIRYNNLFIKDYLFITTPLLIASTFVILPTFKNTTFFIILLSSIFVLLIFIILTFTKYQFIQRVELFLSNSFFWIMSFIFVVILLISVLPSLATNFYEIIEFSQYSFIYKILKFKNEYVKKMTSFVFNNVLLVVIFILFIAFNKKNKIFTKYVLYILGTQFVIFYNPYSLYFFEKIIKDFYSKTFVIYENSFWISIFILSTFLINYIYKKISWRIKVESQKIINKTKLYKNKKMKKDKS